MSLSDVDKASFKTYGQNPGQSQVVQTNQAGEVEREVEFFQLPGFRSGTTPKETVFILDADGSYKLIVGSHNYSLTVTVNAGEVKIFSTDSSGTTKKAEIFLKTNGKIKISNSDEDYKTALFDLIDAIRDGKTFGSPATQEFDPATKTQINSIKTRLSAILTD